MLRLDGFFDFSRLGGGPAGDVYRATRAERFEPVAIRVLPSGAGRSAERDLELLVGWRHSAAINIVELISADETTHVVMEFADGGTWSDLITRRGSAPSVPELIVVGERTAAVLAELHGLGVLHEAVRAHNVLVSDGEFDVSDLGVAALHGPKGNRPRTGVRTIQDVAPEVMRGGSATSASDVYQLAAMLAYQRRASPAQPQARSAEASPELDGLLAACLHPNPTRRPRAAEVRDWFVAIASSMGAAPALSSPPPITLDPPLPTPSAEHAATVRPGPTERPAPTIEPPRRRPPLAPPIATEPILRTEPATARRRRRMLAGLAAGSIIGAAVLVVGLVMLTGSRSGDGELPAQAAPDIPVPDDSAPAVTVTPTTASNRTTVTPSSVPGAVIPATPVTPPMSTVVERKTRPDVRSVSASAVRPGSTDACGAPTSYEPELAVDGSTDTAWMVRGDGSGQSITLRLAGPSTVRSVGLVPGYDKFDPCLGTERFGQFRRITSVRWTFDDGTSIDHVIDPVPAMASLRLPTPRATSSVRLTVLETTAPGDERLDHTAVSEIAIR